MAVGDPYKCGHCGDKWVWGEDDRDEYCRVCFNPHHESGKTKGLRTNIEVTEIGWKTFAHMLDTAMEAEYQQALKRQSRRKAKEKP